MRRCTRTPETLSGASTVGGSHSALNKALRERCVNRRIANRQRERFRLARRRHRTAPGREAGPESQISLQTPVLEDSAASSKRQPGLRDRQRRCPVRRCRERELRRRARHSAGAGASAVGGTCAVCPDTAGAWGVAGRVAAAFGRRAGSGVGNKAWYPYRTTKERTTASRTRFSIGVRRAAAGPERDQPQRRRVGDIEPDAPRPSRPRGRRRGVESPRPHSPNTTGGSGTIRRRGATTAVCMCGAPRARDVEPESVARDHRSAAARRAAARRQAPRKSSSRLVYTASNSSRRGITRMSTGRPACGGW